MKYNFDQEHDTLYTNTAKWSMAKAHYGEADILPLWVAEMDFKLPPEITNEMKRKGGEGLFGYTKMPDPVLKSVADWVEKRHGVTFEKEAICFSPGVMPAIFNAIKSLTKTNDPIIIQPPVYGPFEKAINNSNRNVVTNPLKYQEGRYEMDLDDLSHKVQATGAKMLMLCSPHNPVGRVWSKKELHDLATIVEENDLLVVSDEIHADLILNQNKHTIFSEVSELMAHRSIICTSASKSFNLAGLNTSFTIIENKELREAFQSELDRNFQSMVNPFSAYAVKTVYDKGADWLDQCLDYVEDNLEFLKSYVVVNIPQIKVVEPEGTYLVWIDFRALGLEQDQLFKFIIKEGKVALNNGAEFGAEGNGFLRMNLACKKSTLEEALKRLEEAISKL